MASGRAPYTEFAVFGPYGRRYSKLRKFEAQVFVHGELTTRMLRGPASFEAWKACWRVFRSCMLMLRAATPSALDAYKEGIRMLVTLYPGAWGVIQVADETVRGEQWDLRCEERLRAGAPLTPRPLGQYHTRIGIRRMGPSTGLVDIAR